MPTWPNRATVVKAGPANGKTSCSTPVTTLVRYDAASTSRACELACHADHKDCRRNQRRAYHVHTGKTCPSGPWRTKWAILCAQFKFAFAGRWFGATSVITLAHATAQPIVLKNNRNVSSRHHVSIQDGHRHHYCNREWTASHQYHELWKSVVERDPTIIVCNDLWTKDISVNWSCKIDLAERAEATI